MTLRVTSGQQVLLLAVHAVLPEVPLSVFVLMRSCRFVLAVTPPASEWDHVHLAYEQALSVIWCLDLHPSDKQHVVNQCVFVLLLSAESEPSVPSELQLSQRIYEDGPSVSSLCSFLNILNYVSFMVFL